jgi:Inner membrane component of T3SS, cytoplasmic domain
MQAKCPHCGATNPVGKILCGTCGKAMMGSAPPAKPQPIPQPQSQPPAQPTTPPPAPAPLPAAAPPYTQGNSALPASLPTQPAPSPVPPAQPAPSGTRPVTTPPVQAPPVYRAQPAQAAPSPMQALPTTISAAPVYPARPADQSAPGMAPGSSPAPTQPMPTPAMQAPVISSAGAPSAVQAQKGLLGQRRLAVGRATWLGAIAGGLGGLIPELILSQLGGAISPPIVYDFLVFCSMGLLVGAALGVLDGLMARHSELIKRDLRRGAIIGLVGGVITLVLAELIFNYLGATDFARNIGWIVFGAPFGAIQGFRRRSSTQGLLGMVGGALGGLIGGFLTNLTIPFGLAIMGFLIGLCSGLLHDIFKRAWLRVMSGRSEGREVILDKRVTVLGSGDVGKVDFGLYGDQGVVQRHAEIIKQGNGYQIAPVGGAPILINGMHISQAAPLRDGDRIQLGSTILDFQSRNTK